MNYFTPPGASRGLPSALSPAFRTRLEGAPPPPPSRHANPRVELAPRPPRLLREPRVELRPDRGEARPAALPEPGAVACEAEGRVLRGARDPRLRDAPLP